MTEAHRRGRCFDDQFLQPLPRCQLQRLTREVTAFRPRIRRRG